MTDAEILAAHARYRLALLEFDLLQAKQAKARAELESAEAEIRAIARRAK